MDSERPDQPVAASVAPAPPLADEPMVKAAFFTFMARAIEQVASPERYALFFAALEPETRYLVTHPPPAATWVHSRWRGNLMEQAFRVAFAGDAAQMREMGRVCFLLGFRTIYRIFIKLLSPNYVASRVKPMWAMAGRNNGTMDLLRNDPDLIEIRQSGLTYSGPWVWEFTCGGMVGLGEVIGVKTTGTVFTVSADGKSCTFAMRWQR